MSWTTDFGAVRSIWGPGHALDERFWSGGAKRQKYVLGVAMIGTTYIGNKYKYNKHNTYSSAIAITVSTDC